AGAGADQARDKFGIGLGLFPARQIDAGIRLDGRFEGVAAGDDFDPGAPRFFQLLALPAEGISQDRGKTREGLFGAAAVYGKIPVAESEECLDNKAGRLQSLNQAGEGLRSDVQWMNFDCVPGWFFRRDGAAKRVQKLASAGAAAGEMGREKAAIKIRQRGEGV